MNKPLKQHLFEMQQNLIWRDMDAYQHINNAVYFRYFEDIRIAWFTKVKIMEYFEKTKIGPILASARCDFRSPLVFPDRILITADIENIRKKRFTMKHTIYSENQEKIAAEGESLVVYYDYNQFCSCAIPEEVLANMEKSF